MNRADRRNQNRVKSTSKTGLTFLALAGVIGGSVGIMSPAHAADYSPTTCNELARDLSLLAANGGTLTADFTGNCDFAEGYIFQSASTIIGPTDGTLNLRFSNSATHAFQARSEFSISNLNFTLQADEDAIVTFIYGWADQITVSNSTFSNATVGAAIYAEGNLTVSDSAFTNLSSDTYGVAIRSEGSATANITNSIFEQNQSKGGGGAVYSSGNLTVENSSFSDNSTLDSGHGGAIAGLSITVNGSTFFNNHADQGLGGAILAGTVNINNSTFVNNRASDIGAVFSEGGIVSNSTFWNNTGFPSRDTASSVAVINGDFFGNILANSDTSPVISNGVIDRGANLFTDTSFASTTVGAGASRLVTLDELKLSTLALNQTSPTNSGNTKTVAIGIGSIAQDYYTSDPEIDRRVCISSCNFVATDQRGVARPFGAGYDVGAFEIAESTDPSPSETPVPRPSESIAVTERGTTDTEVLADTGLGTEPRYLGLIGVGLAAIFGGSVGLLRRRKKA
jgi:hypothetical protein